MATAPITNDARTMVMMRVRPREAMSAMTIAATVLIAATLRMVTCNPMTGTRKKPVSSDPKIAPRVFTA